MQCRGQLVLKVLYFHIGRLWWPVLCHSVIVRCPAGVQNAEGLGEWAVCNTDSVIAALHMPEHILKCLFIIILWFSRMFPDFALPGIGWAHITETSQLADPILNVF